MRRLSFAALVGVLAVLGGAPAAAQQPVATGATVTIRLPDGAGNRVSVLEADAAGRLYAGPRLVVVAPDGTISFPGTAPAFDPPTAIGASVFALATGPLAGGGSRVVAALGFFDTAADPNQPPPTAAGFAVSADGGATWTYRFAALDTPDDTLVTYGVSTLRAVPTTAPQGAATLDLAAHGDTLYAASGLAGLRRSVNGATWSRVVLPPDSLVVLDPREPQFFAYSPGQIEPTDDPAVVQVAFASANFIAYSVHVDAGGTLWAGSANGLNRAVRLPGVADPAWIRYLDGPIDGFGPPANLVYALAEQPATGRLWLAAWNSGLDASTLDEEDGVAVFLGDDADGRARFATVLPGVRATAMAFDGPRAAVAGGRDGLYLADDATGTEIEWRSVRTFRDGAGQPLAIRPDASVLSVAFAASALWAGTSDGLLRSTDAGLTWSLFRASPPPDTTRDGDAVDVYAYPNPFRPGTDRLARIRFDLDGPADVTVRLYDVSMRPVRTIDQPGRSPGPVEIAWDGLADDGRRVANGAYIYTVEAGGRRLSGRILVYQ